MRVIGLTLLAALALAAPAAAAKPDLIVSAGQASISGTTISGSFTIRNKGGRAAASSAVVAMVSPGYANEAVTNPELKGIKKQGKRTVSFSAEVPASLKPLAYRVRACADPYGAVGERNEKNNCRKIADVVLGGGSGQAAPATPAGPVEYTKESPVQLESGRSSYWVQVPQLYDDSHKTQVPMLVWLHGCGGDSGGDIYTVSPTEKARYLAIAVGGRDGACWDVNNDSALVLAAIENVRTHFQIDPRRIVLGGFSSGGDLAYRTAYFNSDKFSGVLAAGTAPFRDTGTSREAALAAATTKFHVVHLAHLDDEAYPIATVREETDALKSAGFPLERVERPGMHYDENTDKNIQEVLLPHMADDWTSPF